jgi:triacylglycerol esterase/lipase EstA (alpha/beta hydrolase family)
MPRSGMERAGTMFRKIFSAMALASLAVGLFSTQARADDSKARVIVFVHGLHGDRETWVAPNGAYWPDMVRVDPRFQKSDVFVAAYPTPSSSGQYSTTQLAQRLWQQLKDNRVWDHREVVFIAHSLGGLITEEMLLSHPVEAAKTRFIVSYATPHEGSFVASFAKIYDSDPLLTDLSDSNDNNFLQNLELHWRSTASVARIHRFCAYETQDTAAGEGIGRYLRAHTRVVSYYSATYGCDTDTPPQKINADHIGIVKPNDRNADAYTFFARVYHSNPIIDVVESVRDYKVPGLYVDCNKTSSSNDLQVAAPLDAGLHEQVLSAQAELVDREKIRDVTQPVVTKVDLNGVAHVSYSFRGDGRGLGILGCPTGHAAMLVHFKIHSEIPEKE